MPRSTNPANNPLIDSPPFRLEEEIRLSETRSGFWAVVAGLLVLVALQVLTPRHAGRLPSLTMLLTISLAAGASYVLVRYVSYWIARIVVTQMYAPIGRVHPAASGELPRTAFLCVLLAPGIVAALACTIAAKAGAAFGPEFRLAVAVVIGVALRDLRAAYRVLLVPASRWIKEKRNGLEVLQPVDGA
jgi:hypothetical protein